MCFKRWVYFSKAMSLHPLIMIFSFLVVLTLLCLDLMNSELISYWATTLVIIEWVVIDHFLHYPLSFTHEFIF
jgi:hypothetical protein